VRFSFVDELLEKLLKRAAHSVEDLNLILEFVDFFTEPESIVE
jgi:hypothetical protein